MCKQKQPPYAAYAQRTRCLRYAALMFVENQFLLFYFAFVLNFHGKCFENHLRKCVCVCVCVFRRDLRHVCVCACTSLGAERNMSFFACCGCRSQQHQQQQQHLLNKCERPQSVENKHITHTQCVPCVGLWSLGECGCVCVRAASVLHCRAQCIC